MIMEIITSVLLGFVIVIFLFFPAAVGYWFFFSSKYSDDRIEKQEKVKISWANAIIPVIIILICLFWNR